MRNFLFTIILPVMFLMGCQLPTDVDVEEITIDQEVNSRSLCIDKVYSIQAFGDKQLGFCNDGTWVQVKKIGTTWIQFGALNGTWVEDFPGHLHIEGLYNYKDFSLWVGLSYELDGPLMKPLIFIQ
jgi:hypothetical protein